MWRAALLLLAACLAAARAAAVAGGTTIEPDRPVWPEEYQVGRAVWAVGRMRYAVPRLLDAGGGACMHAPMRSTRWAAAAGGRGARAPASVAGRAWGRPLARLAASPRSRAARRGRGPPSAAPLAHAVPPGWPTSDFVGLRGALRGRVPKGRPDVRGRAWGLGRASPGRCRTPALPVRRGRRRCCCQPRSGRAARVPGAGCAPCAPPCPPSPACSYKYQAWQDAKLGRQKIVRDGVETVVTLVPGEPSLPAQGDSQRPARQASAPTRAGERHGQARAPLQCRLRAPPRRSAGPG